MKIQNGNDHFVVKDNYYKYHSSNFNTIFLGSSRTFRQINPYVFDSIVKINGTDITSFNFGAPATFFPECFYLINYLSSRYKFNNVFLELQPVNDIGKQNIFAYKSYYYLNHHFINFVINFAYYSNMPITSKIDFSGKYLLSYFYKLVAGKYVSILQQNSSGQYVLGKNNNGYFALDEQLASIKTESQEINNNRNKLLKDTTLLSVRKRASKSALNENDGDNMILKKYLEKLSEDFQNKNINLYFIIPPRLSNYSDYYALKNSAMKNRIIDLSNGDDFPEFYQIKYSFDIGHLNNDGARLYTKALAEKYLEILKIKDK